jgi:hypothetical protein
MFLRLMLSGALAFSSVITDVAAAKAEVLKGRTAQGYRIKATTHGERSVRLLDFKADLECRDGTLLQLSEGGFLPSDVRPNGTVHEAQYGDTDAVFIRGRIENGTIQGRLRLTDRWGRGNPCRSRWIKFQAD